MCVIFSNIAEVRFKQTPDGAGGEPASGYLGKASGLSKRQKTVGEPDKDVGLTVCGP